MAQQNFNDTAALPIAEIDRVLACRDGGTALLYLYLKRTAKFSLVEAERTLGLSQSDIARGLDTLRRLGISADITPLLTTEELPQYNAEDISLRKRDDPAFQAILSEAARLFGRILSENDMRVLMGIYDHFGLPAEVVLPMLTYCVATYKEQNGEGRVPTMRMIEREAKRWVEAGVSTSDEADTQIKKERALRDAVTRVRLIMQIRDRNFTNSELELVRGWLSLGYTPEAIETAYDRTVTATGKLNIKYMNAIIRSWYDKGLITLEEIREKDGYRDTRPPTAGRRGAEQRPAATGTDEDDTERMLRRLNGGRN